MNRDDAVARLLGAEAERATCARVTDDWPDLDVATAYEVQDAALDARLARGEHLVGVKLGLTSRPKQQRMGIDTPITAWLTDRMALPSGMPVRTEELIHARAEPELAFVMGERLAGPGVTAAAALGAVRRVHGAVEIIDSRYRDFSFTLADVIADNASSGRFVLGPVGLDPATLDLSLEACLVELDGKVVDSATGAAVMGHPAEAVAYAANLMAERGRAIEAGMIVLTGGMTDAVELQVGTSLTVSFTSLGAISLTTV